ncbi:uncharacterized protein LOC106159281 [Lingula anatina]|uniref:Uncharacterized protein LOC106159281 n=1 Tax=Lingula anatina TaxID=7574 RepID=A0A1S3HY58_LINAN|nr:uncharacterized protein LOC106159281 [Lingula anatina]|eukprot:XP_013390962.1 uncharacterized protein LOC106159281 [Lingula anatina]
MISTKYLLYLRHLDLLVALILPIGQIKALMLRSSFKTSMGPLLRSYISCFLGLFLVANVGAEYRYIPIWNEDYGTMVQCRDIQCEKGQYAKLCTPHDRDSSRCVPCEDGYYQDDNVNPLGKKCKLKRLCLDQNPDVQKCTTVKDPGSLTKDAECSCLQGCTWHKSLAECIPDPSVLPTTSRPPCPPDQTTKENSTGCFPECPEDFFKDGDSCKQYTNCRREGKCVEIKGNATADNICSATNFTDWTKDCNQTGPSQQQKSEGPKMLMIILGVTVPGVILCALAIITYCAWKWTTNKKNEEQNRQEILARLTSGTLEGEVLHIAFGIVENNIGKNWERLGRRLLENFDTTVRFEIYEAYPPSSTPLADRVNRMLTMWKEKRAIDATVAALMQALDFIGQGNISHTILQKIEGLLSETDSTNFTDENRDLAVHSSSVPDVHETARRRDHRQDNLPPCKSVSVNEINQGKQQRSVIMAAASSGIGLSSSDAKVSSVPNFAQIKMQKSHQRSGSDGSVTSRDSLLGESKDTVDEESKVVVKETCV